MPTRTNEHELFHRYQVLGDLGARDDLVLRFLPLARALARRYDRSGEPFDDLLQVASVGLVKALERFDAGRGTAFSSFAVPTIVGELKRHFRDSGWAAHVPRGTQELALRMNEAVERLTGELGRSPALTELAGDLGIGVEAVLEAREAWLAHDAASLDAPRSPGGDDDEPTRLSRLSGEERCFELIENGLTIAPVLRALPERERAILRLRFVNDLTQAEIAERLEISQMHVSRLLRRSLARIRVVLESSETRMAA